MIKENVVGLNANAIIMIIIVIYSFIALILYV